MGNTPISYAVSVATLMIEGGGPKFSSSVIHPGKDQFKDGHEVWIVRFWNPGTTDRVPGGVTEAIPIHQLINAKRTAICPCLRISKLKKALGSEVMVKRLSRVSRVKPRCRTIDQMY